MTINVDPELGEILGLLDYKIQRSTFTEQCLLEELGWEVGYFRRIFEDEKDIPLERLCREDRCSKCSEGGRSCIAIHD